jgi:DNA polymerase III alpha subunit (gram-positive type)
VRLARRLLPELRRRSLDYVAMHYGVEIHRRHRAGGDAIATAQVLIRLLAAARERGCERWEDLELLLASTPRRRRARRRPARPQPVTRDTTA